MSGDYPLGADCDVDAMLSSDDLPTLRKLSALLETITSDMDDELHRAVLRYTCDLIDAFKSKVEGPPDPSSQPSGDCATEPGGGAPTSRESGTLTDSAPPDEPPTPRSST